MVFTSQFLINGVDKSAVFRFPRIHLAQHVSNTLTKHLRNKFSTEIRKLSKASWIEGVPQFQRDNIFMNPVQRVSALKYLKVSYKAKSLLCACVQL